MKGILDVLKIYFIMFNMKSVLPSETKCFNQEHNVATKTKKYKNKRSYNFNTLSFPPEATNAPSGDQSTAYTSSA